MLVLSREVATVMSNAIMLTEYMNKELRYILFSQVPLNSNYIEESQYFDQSQQNILFSGNRYKLY